MARSGGRRSEQLQEVRCGEVELGGLPRSDSRFPKLDFRGENKELVESSQRQLLRNLSQFCRIPDPQAEFQGFREAWNISDMANVWPKVGNI